MKRYLLLALAVTGLLCPGCKQKDVPRPQILAVAHAAFFTSDYESVCQLYGALNIRVRSIRTTARST